jgi:hypothetical protein
VKRIQRRILARLVRVGKYALFVVLVLEGEE